MKRFGSHEVSASGNADEDFEEGLSSEVDAKAGRRGYQSRRARSPWKRRNPRCRGRDTPGVYFSLARGVQPACGCRAGLPLQRRRQRRGRVRTTQGTSPGASAGAACASHAPRAGTHRVATPELRVGDTRSSGGDGNWVLAKGGGQPLRRGAEDAGV